MFSKLNNGKNPKMVVIKHDNKIYGVLASEYVNYFE
jgi:hypothetical protein